MAHLLTFYQLLVTLALDEGFHFLAADVIAELFGGRLEKIGRWSNDGPTQFAIKRDLGTSEEVQFPTPMMATRTFFVP